MTATTESIRTPEKGDGPLARTLPPMPVLASTVILAGIMVAVTQAGYLVPASADPTLRVIGRSEEYVDNSAGTSGAKTCRVKRGVFGWQNSSSTQAVSDKYIGRYCYAVDNQTVALRNPTGEYPVAGRIYDLDDDGLVYVEMGVATPDDPSADDIFLLAGADLSTTGQNRFVALNSSGAVVLAATAGMAGLGVLVNAPASGAVAIVRRRGRIRAAFEEAVTEGVHVAVAVTTGRAKICVAGTVSGSNVVGSYSMGQCLEEASGSGDLAMIDVQPGGVIPTTLA